MSGLSGSSLIPHDAGDGPMLSIHGSVSESQPDYLSVTVVLFCLMIWAGKVRLQSGDSPDLPGFFQNEPFQAGTDPKSCTGAQFEDHRGQSRKAATGFCSGKDTQSPGERQLIG